MGSRLAPRHNEAGAVRTEDGIAGVLQIMLGIVADMLDDLFGIMARQVALRHTNKAAKPARVRCDLQGVTLHFGDGRKARDDGVFPLGLRRLELRAKALHVRNGAADLRLRNL